VMFGPSGRDSRGAAGAMSLVLTFVGTGVLSCKTK
jgi:hypothetical protein